MTTFAAIDFETANDARDSACAVAVVVASGGRVVYRKDWLVRPPTREFRFTHIHGLTWRDVRNAPTFGELWPELQQTLDHVDFLAAHNAPFDHGVLRACCARYRLDPPGYPFVCTVKLARQVWGIYPTKLPNVCEHLGIPLVHHQATSDAEACARIVLAAKRAGWQP